MKYVQVVTVFFFLVLVSSCNSFYGIGDNKEKKEIQEIIDKADCRLFYNLSTEYSFPDDEPLRYKHDVIFIDYDKVTISFLSYADVYRNFHTFKLAGNNTCNEDCFNESYLQVDYTIPSSGNRLRTFYPFDIEHKHRTNAIQLITQNGTTYSICDLKDKDTGYSCFLALDVGMPLEEFTE
jgi:hypothetical protein